MAYNTYSDEALKNLQELKENSDLTWEQITYEWNKLFAKSLGAKTLNALRKTYRRTTEMLDAADEADEIDSVAIQKSLESNFRTTKSNKVLKQQLTAVVQNKIQLSDIIEGINTAVKNISFHRPILKKVSLNSDTKKTQMIPLVMVSDVHFGLKTQLDNLEINRKKMAKLGRVFIDEIIRYNKNFNIPSLIVNLGGDLIQSASMHKMDSKASCDLTDAEQVAVAIESIYEDLILPLTGLGIPIKINSICGNHDRVSVEKPTVRPGKEYFTYTIAHTLRTICKAAGHKDITFEIPEKPYMIFNVFGSNYLLEHGHLFGAKPTLDALERHLMKRSNQVGKLLAGIIYGHFHTEMSSTAGRFLGNGGFPSDDHFSDSLGYKSVPSQIIVFFVKTTRPTSYYHSFPVQLEDEI